MQSHNSQIQECAIANRKYLKTPDFSYFLNYLPLDGNQGPHLNNFRSTLPNESWCQVWFKLAQRIWRLVENVNSLQFQNYLSFKKEFALYFKNLESFSHKDALNQVWLNLNQWFQRKNKKCEPFTVIRTDERRTNDGQHVIRKNLLAVTLVRAFCSVLANFICL